MGWAKETFMSFFFQVNLRLVDDTRFWPKMNTATFKMNFLWFDTSPFCSANALATPFRIDSLDVTSERGLEIPTYGMILKVQPKHGWIENWRYECRKKCISVPLVKEHFSGLELNVQLSVFGKEIQEMWRFQVNTTSISFAIICIARHKLRDQWKAILLKKSIRTELISVLIDLLNLDTQRKTWQQLGVVKDNLRDLLHHGSTQTFAMLNHCSGRSLSHSGSDCSSADASWPRGGAFESKWVPVSLSFYSLTNVALNRSLVDVQLLHWFSF